MKTAKTKPTKKTTPLEALATVPVAMAAAVLEMFAKPKPIPDSFSIQEYAEAPFGTANRDRILKADEYGPGWEGC